MTKKIFFLSLFFLSMSGCGGIFPLPSETPKKITLNSLGLPPIFPKTKKPKGQICVEIPAVFAPIDNTRVALSLADHQIDYYAQIEWADRLGTLIQDSLVYSLQNSQCFKGVSRSADGLIPDYVLKIEVRRFYIDRVPTPPQAVVDYLLQLVQSTNRQVVDTKQIFHTVCVKDETTTHVVQSLNQAHLEALETTAAWLSTRCHP